VTESVEADVQWLACEKEETPRKSRASPVVRSPFHASRWRDRGPQMCDLLVIFFYFGLFEK
jgi:hypothetical protein